MIDPDRYVRCGRCGLPTISIEDDTCINCGWRDRTYEDWRSWVALSLLGIAVLVITAYLATAR